MNPEYRKQHIDPDNAPRIANMQMTEDLNLSDLESEIRFQQCVVRTPECYKNKCKSCVEYRF